MITMGKLALRNIKENKKWAMMTILGISISLMLITMVVSFGVGTYQSFAQEYIETSTTGNIGFNYDANNKDADFDLLDYLNKQESIERYYAYTNYGYVEFPEDQEFTLQVGKYLNLPAEDSLNRVIGYDQPKLIKGRFPENNDELLWPLYGMYEYAIGDTARVYNQSGELELKTVVGLIDSPFAYLKGDYGNVELVESFARVDVEFKDGIEFNEVVSGIKKDLKLEHIDYSTMLNSLKGYTLPTNPLFFTAVGLIGIIILIIALSSISLIYNSFYLSLEQKVQQIGLLKSIGATNKQISKMVYFEGFIITLISITLGIFGGYFLAQQALNYIGMTFNSLSQELYRFKPVLMPSVIVTIYVLGFLTVYLPIRKSVCFANKVSPVETIRNINRNDDQLKYKKVPSYVGRFFKTSGELAVKNYHRDRKKHRSTGISLVITIILFISITSFVGYGKQLTQVVSPTSYDLMFADYTQELASTEVFNEFINSLEASYPDAKFITYTTVGLEQYNPNPDVKEAFNYPLTEQFEHYDLSLVGYMEELIILNDQEFIKYFGSDQLMNTVLNSNIQGKLPIVENDKIKELYVDSQFIDVKPGDTFKYRFYDRLGDASENDIIQDITIDTVVEKFPFELRTHNTYTGINMVVSMSKLKEMGIYDYYYDDIKYEGTTLTLVSSKDHLAIQKDFNDMKIAWNESNDNIVRLFDYNLTNDNLILASVFGTIDLVAKIITGFVIVICISNLLNVLASTSRQRLKEYGVYRSVGMNLKDLRKMVIYETFINSWKPLVFGSVIGVGLSYIMYLLLTQSMTISTYQLPWSAIGNAVILVLVVQSVQLIVSIQLLKKSNIVQDLKRMEM